MAKKKIAPSAAYQHNKGQIRDNAVFALLHDSLFRPRVERKLKGRGSYQRKGKHRGAWLEKPDQTIFNGQNSLIGLFSF